MSARHIAALKALLFDGLTQAEVLTTLSECGDARLYGAEIEMAREEHCDDGREIDDKPLVAVAEGEGVWVSGWFLVAAPAVEESGPDYTEPGCAREHIEGRPLEFPGVRRERYN